MTSFIQSSGLKIMSLVIGYGLWYVLSRPIPTHVEMTIPVCFYNTPSDLSFQAPEAITVCLSGPRPLIAGLDKNALALHIDATKLSLGKNAVTITQDSLFLPNHIKLVSYVPSNIIIVAKQTQKGTSS
jgi:hypothetical protein